MRLTQLLMLTAYILCGVGCETAPPEQTSTASTSIEASKPTNRAAGDLSQLSIKARRTVQESTLPVLLFGAPYDQDSMIMGGDVWYAISINQPNITLTLHASNKVHGTLPGEPKFDSSVRGQGANTSDNDGIRGVSWKENDTYYVVEAECHEASDERCLKNDFVLSLANNMVRAK